MAELVREYRPNTPVDTAPIDTLRQTYGLDFDEVMELIDAETLNEQERRMLEETRAGAVRSELEAEQLLQDLLNGPKRAKRGVQPVLVQPEHDEDEADEYRAGPREYPAPEEVQTPHLVQTEPVPGTVSVQKWWLRK